ncbi:MAG: ABC transporter permease [Candidatus Heimdallarchaeota archaeon]
MPAFFRMSWQALRDRKLRSLLTVTMVLIGASLIVAVNGMSKGTVTYIDSQFSSIASNVLVLTPRSSDLNLDSQVLETIERYPGVDFVIPFIQNGIVISSGSEETTSIALGIENAKLPLIFPSFSLYSGDFVSEVDRFGIILGNEVARPERVDSFATVGDIIKLQFQKTEGRKTVLEKKSFYVRGVAEYIGTGMGVIPLDDLAIIPYREADSLFDRKGIYDGIYVITASDSENQQVRTIIGETYDVSILSPKTISDLVNRVSGAVAEFVNNVAVVSLGVAAVGIITTLYTSMMERTKEIGTLKALGYRKRQILVLFLNEALITGVIGGTLGLGVGVGLGYVMNYFVSGGGGWRMVPIFEPHVFVFTWVLTVILAMGAGFYPAWKAAKLDPVVALRKE